MDQAEKPTIAELQLQVKWLTRAVIYLALLIAINAGLIPLALGALLGLLLLLPVLAFTHQWLPPLARQIGYLISWFVPHRRTVSRSDVR